ncbi:MAG: GNAT family N-acetyltransferase [Paenibacillaceae bacterium]
MKIYLAPVSHIPYITSFFYEHLTSDNDALYSREFFCPDGVQAAIRRGQVMVAVDDDRIVGAVRFYKRKTQNIISLYQFAIDAQYRGQGLLIRMFAVIGEAPIEISCPIDSTFNEYYIKTGWILQGEHKGNNQYHYLSEVSQ